jgi:CTP:molybdopterin cytidylyltransferase MocA
VTESSLPPLPETPLVSVLTLTYNQEAFVAEAIESVLAQEWPADRLEFVVINDGSTDGTASALDRYRSDARVRVIDQENQGLLRSLRIGMELMTGDVFCACAGDDAMKPGRIARLVRALQEHPSAGLAYSDMELIDARGAVLEPSFLDAAGLPRMNGRARGRLLARNFISGGSCMLRGSLKPVFHPTPEHVAWEDYWWAWALAGVADFVHVPEPLYRYRFHGRNMSLGARGEQLAAAMAEELPFRRFLLSDVGAADATEHELLEGIVATWRLVSVASEEGRARLVPSDAERAEAARWLERAIEAAAAGERDEAALACCRAAGLHLLDPALFALVRELAGELQNGGAALPVRDRAVLDELGARRFVALVDAEQLVAVPELVSAYASRFGADDDATLVIHAAGASWATLSAAVPRLIAEVGLDGDDAPDMVFTTEPPERLHAIASGADAVLGAETYGSERPVFGVADADSLRLLARRVWSRVVAGTTG